MIAHGHGRPARLSKLDRMDPSFRNLSYRLLDPYCTLGEGAQRRCWSNALGGG